MLTCPIDTVAQHRVYIAVVLLLNLALIVNSVLFPLAIMNLIVVGLPHFRDLLYILLRMLFHRCKFVQYDCTGGEKQRHGTQKKVQRWKPRLINRILRSLHWYLPRKKQNSNSNGYRKKDDDDHRDENDNFIDIENNAHGIVVEPLDDIGSYYPISKKARMVEKTVVAVIPAYKEDPEEVELTLTSISQQIEPDLNIAMVIVSDGFLDYHEIIDEQHEICHFEYTTYKREPNTCSVLLGTYKQNGTPVIVAKKAKNAGKKDSLVVTDDIFIKSQFFHEHRNDDDQEERVQLAEFARVRETILNAFQMDSCDFIFHTDADSVIGPTAFRRMCNALLSNDKIAGVAGLVLVPFEGWKETGFWNLFQGFQYYYGQVIRKATDSLWGKTTCLPGCVTMVRSQHPAIIEACDRYNKLPSSNFIFQVKNRLQGTDRRYTNCVLQHSLDTFLVVDMKSDCYTVPPQSMDHFRSQRKRWTSNAITGNWFLIFGANIPWYTRCLCAVDVFRIHTSITRCASTIQFFMALFGGEAEVTGFQIAMLALVLALPYLFFLSTITKRGRYGQFLFVGSIISKICSPFITIYIFLYAMWYFNDLNWGKTHGSQPTADTTAAAPADSQLDEESRSSLELVDVGL